MSWQLEGSGSVLDAGAIGNLLQQAPNGQALLQMDLRTSIAGSVVTQIQNTLSNAGVPGVQVYTGSPILNIQWENESGISGISQMDPLTAIAIILGVLLAAALIIIGWRLYSVIPAPIAHSLVTILAVGGVALLLLSILTKGKSLISGK
jgi:hypothetical protein